MAKTDTQFILGADEDFYKKVDRMRIAVNNDLSTSTGVGISSKFYGLYSVGTYQSGTGQYLLVVAFDTENQFVLDEEVDGYLFERNGSYAWIYDKQPCKFKVIKTDGSKVWAVFYAQIEDEMIKGHMIFTK